MVTIGERIRRQRKLLKMSQSDLGKIVGLKKAQISNIERDRRSTPIDRLTTIADALGLKIGELVNGETGGNENRAIRPVPVVTWDILRSKDAIPVGGPTIFPHKHVGPKSFALRVVGDAMEPRYIDGDIIIVDPETDVSTNDPCVVKIAQDVTFKIYHENNLEIRLKPTNPKHPEIVFPKDGHVEFRIIGKVVDLIAKI